MVRRVYIIPIGGSQDIGLLNAERVRVGNIFNTDRQKQILNRSTEAGESTLDVLVNVDTFDDLTNSANKVTTLTTSATAPLTSVTQSPGDNSTKVATTAYVDAAVVGPSVTLSEVLTNGNSATGQNIINLQQIYSTVATKTTRLYLDSTNANLMYMSGVYGNVNWLVQGTYSGTTPTISISCYDLVHASPYATGMAISRDSILISGSLTGTFPGAQYGADYSANYTSRSLIDQGYAAATFAPISVTNALTATYVGYGSGANVLTGSANLVWNGTTLSVGGYDSMSINGVAVVSMVAIHSDTLSAYESHTHSNTAAAAATFYGARSRGTSAAPSVVQNGDYLSYHAAVGYDGTDYALGGYYAFIIDDTPGNNDMPTKWVLALSPNGTQVPVAALSIASTGAATFASTVSSTGYQISGAAGSGKILRGNGTSFIASTATYPDTATGTGTILQADGTNWVATTATYPNTITSGYIPYATGTNVIGSSANLNIDITNYSLGIGRINSDPTRMVVDGYKSVNGSMYMSMTNGTSGTVALAAFNANNSTGVRTDMGILSGSYTTSGGYVANMGYLQTSSTVGMFINAYGAGSYIKFGAGGTAEQMRLSSVSNLSLGGTATRATTVGTNSLQIFDGTAPVGTLTNGCSFYSTSGEMRVMDAAGNATLLSPHEKGTNYWIYDSVDTTTGKRLKIDMEQFMKWLNKKFKTDFVHEYITNN